MSPRYKNFVSKPATTKVITQRRDKMNPAWFAVLAATIFALVVYFFGLFFGSLAWRAPTER